MAFLCIRSPVKNFSHVFRIRLAPAAILLDIFLCVFNLYLIAEILAEDATETHPDLINGLELEDWVAIIVYSAQIIVAIIGLIAVLFRWSLGILFLTTGYKIIMLSIIVTFVSNWIVWILDLSGVTIEEPWRPSVLEVSKMVVNIVIALLFFITSWHVFSALNSLTLVLSVGGSGWEGMNYEEVQNKQKEKLIFNKNLKSVVMYSHTSDESSLTSDL